MKIKLSVISIGVHLKAMTSIIFKCRHQTAPEYLQELCIPAAAGTSLITLCRSWRFASASLSHFHFWTTRLCCLCPKTVELFAIVTSGSNTYTDILKQAKETSFYYGLRVRTCDCLGCKNHTL